MQYSELRDSSYSIEHNERQRKYVSECNVLMFYTFRWRSCSHTRGLWASSYARGCITCRTCRPSVRYWHWQLWASSGGYSSFFPNYELRVTISDKNTITDLKYSVNICNNAWFDTEILCCKLSIAWSALDIHEDSGVCWVPSSDGWFSNWRLLCTVSDNGPNRTCHL